MINRNSITPLIMIKLGGLFNNSLAFTNTPLTAFHINNVKKSFARFSNQYTGRIFPAALRAGFIPISHQLNKFSRQRLYNFKTSTFEHVPAKFNIPVALNPSFIEWSANGFNCIPIGF